MLDQIAYFLYMPIITVKCRMYKKLIITTVYSMCTHIVFIMIALNDRGTTKPEKFYSG